MIGESFEFVGYNFSNTVYIYLYYSTNSNLYLIYMSF